ncbi:MAG: O-antigen ligase family protein [Planctomycetota bacterium]|jgi:O-antigen ligase/Flp pilus assembly protein TadD
MPGSHRHRHRHQSSRRSRHHSHGASTDAGVQPAADASPWLKSIDFGLLLAVLAVPFAFGGRHAIGEALLVLGAVWASLSLACWLLVSSQPSWVRTRVGPLLLAIPAVGLLQIVTLPQSVLETISPAISDLLPLRNSETTDLLGGEWSHLSLNVYESGVGLTLGVAYVLLFVTAVQRLQHVSDIARAIRWIGLGGAAMAVFGIAQYVFSNGLFYWVLDHPQGSTVDAAKGGFLNKNHFGQFMTLSIGPLVAWLTLSLNELREKQNRRFRRVGREFESRPRLLIQIAIFMAAIAFVMVGVLASRSRGAVVAAASACAVLFVLLYRKQAITARQFGVLSASGVASCLILSLLNSRQLTRLVDRLDFWSDNGRLPIWGANLSVFNEFPVLGTGVGSHRYVAPRYLDIPFMEKEYAHAESSYLQLLTETGLVGFTLAVLCVLVCVFWCFRGLRLSQAQTTTAIALSAVSASLAGSIVHAVSDVVWHVPGCMAATVLLAACACRLYQIERDQHSGPPSRAIVRVPRIVSLGAACGVIVLGCWMASIWAPRLSAEPYWWQYRRLALALQTGKGDPAEDAAALNADAEAVELNRSELRASRFKRKLIAIREASRRNPDDPRFHVRLAIHYASLFHTLQARSDNALPLGQIRDAAVNGGFESHEETRAWLATAFPENLPYADAAAVHCLRAVQQNPLEAFGYLYLAELGFLVGVPAGFEQQCIDQALEIRPYNAQFLFAAGRDAFLQGDVKQWNQHWKKAFHRNEFIQLQIIRQLVEYTEAPVQLVVAAFEPDIDALERLALAAQEAQRIEERDKALDLLSGRLVERAQEPENRDRVDDWLKAAWAYGQLDDPERVTQCLLQAEEAEPSNFVVRLELGAWMLAQGDRAQATEHIQWCLRFQPNNPKVQRLFAALNQPQRSVRHASGQSQYQR